MKAVPWRLQPRISTAISPEFLDGLLASFNGNPSPEYHKYAAASQKLIRVGRGATIAFATDGYLGGKAYTVNATDLQVIRGQSTTADPDFLVEIAAGSWTFQAVIENPVGNGTNPGFWRVGSAENGTTFCIDNGGTRRPWVRVNGTDVLKAASGAQWPSAGLLNIIFRFSNASSVDVWWGGIKQHSATHAVSQNALTSTNSIYQIGRQSAAEYISGNWAAVRFWSRALTEDQISRLARNPWEFYEPLSRRIFIPTVAAASGNTIAVPAASLVLTGFAPTISQTANQTVAVPAGSLSLTGFAPTVSNSANQTVDVPAGALSLTGFAPTVSLTANNVIAVAAGSLSLTGYPPTITGVVSTPDIAVGGGKPRRRRHYVEIDGQYFEVRDHEHAVEILTKLHEAAKEAAPVAVKKAVAEKKQPAPPVMRVVKPDYRQEFVQQLQAQVDAANARMAQLWQETAQAEMVAARFAAELVQEEDDIETLIALGIL